MLPFERLTSSGQARRLRILALEALARYNLVVRRCTLVNRSFNTIFRVDAADGTRAALRVGPSHRIHADGTELAEANWLDSLRDDGHVVVPLVIAASDGSVAVVASSRGVPEPRSCVLFGWVPGRPMSERITLERARALGTLSALLHRHAAAHTPAVAPDVLVGDHVLYWRDQDRLAELEPTYGALLADAAELVQQTLDRLWRNPPHPAHLVHGDLVPSNVMVSGRETVVIDFQDLFWGFEVQDVAITIASLARSAGGRELVDAFRDGYEIERGWPATDADTLATLVAGRYLHQLNLGLNLRKPGLEAFIARQVVSIAEWMDELTPRSG